MDLSPQEEGNFYTISRISWMIKFPSYISRISRISHNVNIYSNNCASITGTLCVLTSHTHHQNGIIERKHRKIVETGLILMVHVSLPFEYWDHEFLASVHLINKLPTSALNVEVLYTKLFKAVSDYSLLKKIGCSCFSLLRRPYDKHKLQYRSQECLFLGYCTSHKCYKSLISNGILYTSKDVLFN